MTRKELREDFDDETARVGFDVNGDLIDHTYIVWLEDKYMKLVNGFEKNFHGRIL